MRIYSQFTNEKNVTEKSVLFSVTVVSYEIEQTQDRLGSRYEGGKSINIHVESCIIIVHSVYDNWTASD